MQTVQEAAQKAAREAVETAQQTARISARKFFENGATYEMVRASIDMLSDEELQSIYEQATIQSTPMGIK